MTKKTNVSPPLPPSLPPSFLPSLGGYDLYVLAVQECRMLSQMRKAIHYHLGGPRAFVLFEQDLGDALVSNGTSLPPSLPPCLPPCLFLSPV